jgi:NAD-dependent SIR2 family protein deacetylase
MKKIVSPVNFNISMTNIKQIINNADGIVILAGAGMGVEAGIPDFRGASGVWTSEKDTFIKFASGNAWHERPLEAWNFYIERFISCGELEPHRGYYDLKNLLARLGKDTFVMTSNVDGHFEKAGYAVDKIYTIHGDLKHIQCSDKCCRDIHPMPKFTKLLDSIVEAPHCDKCGNVMRPLVMMFNDPWFVTTEIDKQAAICLDWLNSKRNIVGIEIGAGLAVPSLRIYGEERTNTLIRINPHDYQIHRPQDIAIEATAIDGIDTLIKIMEQ